MGQVSSKLRRTEDGYAYWCQGCEEMHHVRTNGPAAVWSFDGDLESPSFSPSVMVTSGHYVSSHKPGDPCWCTYNAEHPDRPAPFKCHRCHTSITSGVVQFLGDCSHAFAGQTLPLPVLPPKSRDAIGGDNGR
jgi:hypothetical protein